MITQSFDAQSRQDYIIVCGELESCANLLFNVWCIQMAIDRNINTGFNRKPEKRLLDMRSWNQHPICLGRKKIISVGMRCQQREIAILRSGGNYESELSNKQFKT
jgi:hypothetical protein